MFLFCKWLFVIYCAPYTFSGLFNSWRTFLWLSRSFYRILAKGYEHVSAIGGFIILPLLYLGGVFYSIANLHPVLQSFSKLNPMFYFINGIRYGFLEQSDVDWMQCLWVAILSMVVCMFLSVTRFRSSSFQRW